MEDIENISKQKEGMMKVSLPEINMSQLLAAMITPMRNPVIPLNLTHTTHHYCAYDRFHQDNTVVVEEERLRRLDIVPECSQINSQVV